MLLRFGSCVLLGVLWLATAPAQANHIPGATYRGTSATGGAVEFDVAADGTSITRFVATDVQTGCGGTLSKSFMGTLPIAADAFASDPADNVRFEGSFPSTGTAAGSLVDSSCAASLVSWSAATDAAAATPPPPDTTPPALDARARGSQRLGRGGRIHVRVGCPDEACLVVARGSVSVQGRRVRPFRLKRASARLLPGGSARLEPRLGRRALEAARRALRRGRRVEVRITVAAVDGAGNRAVARLRVRPKALA
jgi:hypothetical protein